MKARECVCLGDSQSRGYVLSATYLDSPILHLTGFPLSHHSWGPGHRVGGADPLGRAGSLVLTWEAPYGLRDSGTQAQSKEHPASCLPSRNTPAHRHTGAHEDTALPTASSSTHLFIHSLIYSLIHSFIHSFPISLAANGHQAPSMSWRDLGVQRGPFGDTR